MFDDVVDVQLAHDDNKNENAKSPKALQGENQSLSRSGSVFNMDVPDPELSTQRAKIASLLQEVRTGKMEDDEKDSTWYLSDFDSKTADKEIIIGSISLQDIEMQERKMENDRLVMLQKEAAISQTRGASDCYGRCREIASNKTFRSVGREIKAEGKKIMDKDEKAARQDET